MCQIVFLPHKRTLAFGCWLLKTLRIDRPYKDSSFLSKQKVLFIPTNINQLDWQLDLTSNNMKDISGEYKSLFSVLISSKYKFQTILQPLQLKIRFKYVFREYVKINLNKCPSFPSNYDKFQSTRLILWQITIFSFILALNDSAFTSLAEPCTNAVLVVVVVLLHCFSKMLRKVKQKTKTKNKNKKFLRNYLNTTLKIQQQPLECNEKCK